MEAALRTAYYLLNKKSAPKDFFELKSIRGNAPIKEANVDLGTLKIKVAVVYGISNIEKIYESLSEYTFVEVMTCPTGCIGGGGQPILPMQRVASTIEARSKSLYENDASLKNRSSYENKDVKKVRETLEEKTKVLLYQEYADKSHLLKVVNKE